jgi:hypothetical protein
MSKTAGPDDHNMPLIVRTCSQYFLQTIAFLSCGLVSHDLDREKSPLLEKSVEASPRPSGIGGCRTLSAALERAHRAVQLDSAGLAIQAVEEYRKTVELLDETLQIEVEDEEAARLLKAIVSCFVRGGTWLAKASGRSAIRITSESKYFY